MANRVIEGFDMLASFLERFSSTRNSVSATTGRNGNCMRKVFDSDAVYSAEAAHATWITGFAFRWSASVSQAREIIWFRDPDGQTNHITINLTPAQKLEARRGDFNGTLLATTTTVMSLNTWYYIEIKVTVNDSSGVVQIRVNEVQEVNFSGDTRNGANGTVLQFIFGGGGAGAGGGNMDYDDWYLHDGSGGVDDAFWGDIKVVTKTVDGVGNEDDFTPSAGSNYQNVDDSTHDSDSTYNASSVAGDVDSMTTQSLATTGTVKGVEVVVIARKTDSGDGSIAPHWRISGVDYPGTGQPLSTTYRAIRERYRLSPDSGTDWTVTEIDGAELGYKRTA